jgi:hypothetical protein
VRWHKLLELGFSSLLDVCLLVPCRLRAATACPTSPCTSNDPMGKAPVQLCARHLHLLPPSYSWCLPVQYTSFVAGTGVAGYGDGTAAGAAFNTPIGLMLDSSGNLYVGVRALALR